MKARTKFTFPLLAGFGLGLAACAPSPLYMRTSHGGTVGEIPRDGRGEPIWSAIRPAPAVIPPAPQPAAAGIPIVPPHD